MKKIFYIIILMVCFSISSYADMANKKAMLSGKITDKVGGSALIGVSVYFPELKTGTVTNENGEYHIDNLPTISTTVQVSYVGHQTIVKSINLQNISNMDFVMKETNAMINEVVVTGLTGSSLIQKSPSPITVVSPSELLQQSSTNIVDAISKQPGISQITTGAGISKPVIRGLGYNRIAVVNDGVRQEGQQWGDEHGIEIDPQTVHSVEILKGPASLMYGSDAMAGVVIFREAPILPVGQIKANVSSEYQTNNGLFGYSLNMAGNNGGLVWNWRYSDKMAHDYKDKYDGYVYDSRFREHALSGLIGINRSWGYSHLTLDAYHLTPGIIEGDKSDDSPKSYGKGIPYQQVYHYKAVWDNSFLFSAGSIKATFAYQQNKRKEFEDEDNPDQCGLNFLLHTVNYDVHYVTPENKDWKLATGINGMYQRSLNEGTEFLVPAYNLFDFGMFATAERDLGKLNISGGLRYDKRHIHAEHLDEDGVTRFSALSRSFNGVTGSLGAVYNILDNLNMRLNLSRGFRAPNISELAANGVHEGTVRYEMGNENLKPENSWQLDFGVDYNTPIISTTLSLFANRINNYIFAEKISDANGNPIIKDGVQTYQFVSGDARILGGEATIDIHPVERLHFENSFSYVNSVQLHQPDDSKYLPFTPAPRWNSELRYDFIRDGKCLNNTYASVSTECDLRQNHFYAANNTETATPSYTLLNAAVGTDIMHSGHKVLSIFLTANNITDRAYQSHLSRLKYTGLNPVTGREGVYNMGRNFGVKVLVPIDL